MHYARVIPYNGSWLDFEFGARDEIYVRIDRKRKILITTFLTAIGMSHDDILDTFYRKKVYTRKYGQWISDLNIERMKDMRITKDVIDADTGDLLLKTGSRVTNRMIFEFGKSEKKEIYRI